MAVGVRTSPSLFVADQQFLRQTRQMQRHQVIKMFFTILVFLLAGRHKYALYFTYSCALFVFYC